MNIFRLAIWDFTGRVANYIAAFVVSVILTRLLTPVEYGIFGIVSSVVSLAVVFVDSGFKLAIIQNKENSQEQLSTIFYINAAIALLMMTGMYLASGFIESFYGIENLSLYLTVISANILLTSLTVVPAALLKKRFEFRAIAFVNTVTPVICGAVAIPMALGGFAVWALIAQPILINLISFLGYSAVARWRPSFAFRPSSITTMWKYGIRMFTVGLMNAAFNRVDILMIGRFFPITTLGFYNRAKQLDVLVQDFSSRTTVSIAFPLFAKYQDELERTRDLYERSLNFVSFVSFFIIGNLFINATDLVLILFTEKWLGVVIYFRILLLIGFAYPVGGLMFNMISARGNANLVLRMSILQKLVLLPTFLPLFFYGIIEFLTARIFATLINIGVNISYVKGEIGTGWTLQIFGIVRYLALAAPIAAVVSYLTMNISNPYIHAALCGSAFSFSYLAGCHFLRFPGYEEMRKRFAPALARLPFF